MLIPIKDRSGKVIAEAEICDEDACLVSGHSWSMCNGYVASRINTRLVYLHRLIKGEPNAQVDHQNRNRLDCKKGNLRIASSDSVNKQNVPGRTGRSSKFRGVHYDNKTKKWATSFGNKPGTRRKFSSEEDAAMFIDNWRLSNLEFAVKEV